MRIQNASCLWSLSALLLATGRSHAQSQVVGWGDNLYGEISIPQPTIMPMRRLACNGEHTAAILADGTVQCWGSNLSNQSAVPFGLGSVVDIAAGGSHTLALKPDGSVACWGDEIFGTCPAPADLGPARAIAAGWVHSAALLLDGGVVCWGENAEGQCDVPPSLPAARAVVLGGRFSAAVLEDGRVRCWGDNGRKQCNVPSTLGPVRRISCGWAFVAAIRANGLMRGWGDNRRGQCSFPATLGIVREVATGDFHTIVIRSNGTVRCFGRNDWGQCTVPQGLGEVVAVEGTTLGSMALLADGTVRTWGADLSGELKPPRAVTDIIGVAAGLWTTVALRSSGTVECWGDNGSGQGDVPTNLTGVTAVAAGGYHTMALRQNGRVVAWGDNTFRQSTVPSGLAGVVAIDAGFDHSMALRSNGQIRAWGSNREYFGAVVGQSSPPASLGAATHIAAGAYFSGILRPDGMPILWGDNSSGQCDVPPHATQLSTFDAGGYFVLGLRTDGSLACWGSNSSGECAVPDNLGTIRQIAAGYAHAAVLLADGSIRSWGNGVPGVLATPDNLPPVTSIAAGDEHIVALLDAPAASCSNTGGAGFAGVVRNGSRWEDIGTWAWTIGDRQVPGALTDVTLGNFGSVGSTCTARARTLETRAGSTLVVAADLANASTEDHMIDVSSTATLAGRISLVARGGESLPADLDIAVLSSPAPVGGFDIIQTNVPAPPGKFLTLVATSSLGGSVTYRLRLLDLPGDAVLGGAGSTSVAGAAIAAETIDLNADGFDDLAIAIDFGPETPGRVQVLLNDGTGELGGVSVIEELPPQPTSIATGDVNGDGRADVVVGIASDSTARLLLGGGTGEGTLTPSTVYTVGARPLSVLVIPSEVQSFGPASGEVAVGSSTGGPEAGANKISFYGPSSGTPNQQVVVTPQPRAIGRRGRIVGTGGSTTTTVDGLAAGAGAAEALVGSSTGAVVLLAPNALGEYGVTQTLGLPAKPRLLDFADIDGDGFAEIVTANDEPQVLGAGAARPVLTLFRGSAGLFGSAVPIEPTGASSGLDVTLVDADGDGDLDIVSVHRTVGTQAAATLIRIDVGAPGGPLTLGAQTTLDADRPRFSARGNLDGTGGEDLFLVEDAAPSSLLGDADATRVRGLLGSLSACVGDLDFDGWVQGSDLALLLTGWAGGAGSQGDLNGDGVVDAADVVQMLVRWGACAP